MERKYPQKRKHATPEEGLEKVIQIDRVNKVVKGGKRMSFRAFVISGNLNGEVGFGLGKSKEVPSAIKKAVEESHKKKCKINIVRGTIPHEVLGSFGASKVILKPAKPGTGVIAGGSVRIVLEALGVKDIVAKSIGAGSPINAAKAALDGLLKLRSLNEEVARRGKALPVYSHQEKGA
ncbi:MAG: 30S ribosomal protein S5 [Candidatus Margulisbacteria bacterium]|nr:30S ribosomal protein S5 [Candidatus Margulisiibacteriota bacterium]